MTLSHLRVVLVCACAFVLAACAGSPTSAPEPTSSSTETSAGTASPRAATLSELDPCTMLDAEQAAHYGYATTERSDFGATMCLYLPARVDPAAGVTSLSISFGDGLAALTPRPIDTVTAEQVGEYSAVRIQAADAPRCTLVIGVNGSQAVHVGATRTTSAEACDQVASVAALIEPVLPAATS